jgi:TPR repeat protein
MYLNGLGLRKDKEEAMELLTESADSAYAPAAKALGEVYFKEQNYEKSFEYFDNASTNRKPLAIFEKAFMTEYALGTIQNTKLAIELYEKAANRNSKFALAVLGYFYGNSRFVRKDIPKSLNYYSRAAKINDNYVPVVFSSKQGKKLLPKLYEAMAIEGDLNSAYMLGFMYENGINTDINLGLAVIWYKMAAVKDLQGAQLNLANTYIKLEEFDEADKWFEIAAKNGSVEALHNRAQLYFSEFNNMKDDKKAFVNSNC